MAKKWSPLLQITPGDGCIKSQTSLVPCNLQCPYRASSLILTHLDHTYDNQHYDVHINAEKDDRGLILMYLRLDKVWCCKSSTSSVDATPPCVCASTCRAPLCMCQHQIKLKKRVDALPLYHCWCHRLPSTCHHLVWMPHPPMCQLSHQIHLQNNDVWSTISGGDFEFRIVSDIIIWCLNTLFTN